MDLGQDQRDLIHKISCEGGLTDYARCIHPISSLRENAWLRHLKETVEQQNIQYGSLCFANPPNAPTCAHKPLTPFGSPDSVSTPLWVDSRLASSTKANLDLDSASR